MAHRMLNGTGTDRLTGEVMACKCEFEIVAFIRKKYNKNYTPDIAYARYFDWNTGYVKSGLEGDFVMAVNRTYQKYWRHQAN